MNYSINLRQTVVPKIKQHSMKLLLPLLVMYGGYTVAKKTCPKAVNEAKVELKIAAKDAYSKTINDFKDFPTQIEKTYQDAKSLASPNFKIAENPTLQHFENCIGLAQNGVDLSDYITNREKARIAMDAYKYCQKHNISPSSPYQALQKADSIAISHSDLKNASHQIDDMMLEIRKIN